MNITALPIHGAYQITAAPHADSRGWFSRLWCQQTLAEHGIDADFVQCSLSHNTTRGTLRGMHYQPETATEGKFVTCLRGAAYDVLLDMRAGSTSTHTWCTVPLTSTPLTSVYIPPGVAHGFQTLEADTQLLYHMTAFYNPVNDRHVYWNDTRFNIDWPLPISQLSSNDTPPNSP